MPTVLITGASRGIGLAVAREFAARDWDVLATCRSPAAATALQKVAAATPSVTVAPLDVADPSSIAAAAAALDRPIDVLFNNAGIGARHLDFGKMDYETWQALMETNLYGPMRMAAAFRDHVASSGQKKIMAVSSSLGSIARSRGGNYAYATSKAALNMAMRSLAVDLKPHGIIVGILSPGFVDTDFTAGTRMPKIAPEVSAAGLVDMCARFDLDMSGRFLRYNGEELDW